MRKSIILSALMLVLFLISFASAVTVRSVDSTSFAPGRAGSITIELENNLQNDVEDVTLSLDLSKVPFSSIGTTEETAEEIEEDESEDFIFRLRAFSSAAPGDYQVPYIITYNDSVKSITRQGTIGLTITADPELEFSVSADEPIVGSRGNINLRVINKGLAEAKFVSVRISPAGYTLLSENNIYLGSIDSDDFETATFEVIFNRERINLDAVVEYTDFENRKQTETVMLPVNIYTRERALELGIIQQSYVWVYVLIVVLIIVIWFILRTIRKRAKLRRSMQEARR